MADQTFDLIVVGGGPGGYVAAIRAAQLGMKTARGRARAPGRHLPQLGLHPDQGAAAHLGDQPPAAPPAATSASPPTSSRFDLDKVVKRSRAVAKQLSQGVAHLMKKNKVTVFDGAAQARRQAARSRSRRTASRSPTLTVAAHHPRDRRARARSCRASSPTAS